MKMSMRRMGLLGLTGLAGVVLAGSVGWAAQPEPWKYGLQEAVTPVMEDIAWFHNILFWLITVITLFVLALLVIIIVKFNAKANPVPSKTTHNTLIEVAWTIIPVLIRFQRSIIFMYNQVRNFRHEFSVPVNFVLCAKILCENKMEISF